MLILGIETSCDETAVALVKDGVTEVASVLATSADLHQKTGGVVPEVAARKQVEFIVPVLEELLRKAGFSLQEVNEQVDAIAVTVGPGLIGSLIVGVEAAKSLALAWEKPLIPVNHLVGHIYANFLHPSNGPGTYTSVAPDVEFPALVLIVSGGHTDLVLMRGHGDLEYLGGTLDDAAGEAFDKTARLLGISTYLGGVLLSKKAAECIKNTLAGRLPRPKINDDDFDFSFSGLKSSVRRLVNNEDHPVNVVACEFETAVVDVLVKKTIAAAKRYNVASILLGGGVAANMLLRSRLKLSAKELGVSINMPPLNLCGDNAVYIASAAYFLSQTGDMKSKLKYPQSLNNVQADPSLTIMD